MIDCGKAKEFQQKLRGTLPSPKPASVEEIEKAQESAASPSAASQPSAKAPPPPPSSVPPPPSSVPPPLPSSQPPVSNDVAQSGVKWKDHPLYAGYFRMLRYGVPIDTIKSKLSYSGLDPSVMELFCVW